MKSVNENITIELENIRKLVQEKIDWLDQALSRTPNSASSENVTIPESEENLSTLYSGISLMLQELEDKFKILEKRNNELEIRVKEKTQALDESQRLTSIGSWEWDIAKNQLKWSDELFRIYGLKPGEKVDYESYLGLIHPDDLELVQNTVEKAFKTGKSYEFHHKILLKDGTVKIIHGRGQAEKDKNGQVIRMFGTGQDVTKLKETEEQLRKVNSELEEKVAERTIELQEIVKSLRHEIKEREEAQNQRIKLAAIVESAEDAIIGKTPDGYITSWNKGAQKMYGYREKEVLGKHISMLVPKEKKKELDVILDKVRKGKKILSLETIRLRKDKSPIYISLTISPIKSPDGKVIGSSAIGKNITDRIKYQEALKENQERLNNFMNSASDIFSLFDENLRLIDINKQGLKLLGQRSKRKLLGRHIADLSPPADKNERYKKIKNVLKTGKSVVLDSSIFDRNEQKLYFQSTVFKVGNGIGIISRDITGQVQSEIAIRTSEKKYRSLIEAMNEGVLMVDSEDRIQFVNPRISEMLGYTEKELTGKKAFDLLLDKDWKTKIKEIIKLRKKGVSSQYEIPLVTKSGKKVWILMSGTPIYDNEGNVKGSIGVLTDITQRKLAEERFHLAVEAAPNSMIMANERGQIVMINTRTEEMFGFKREELIGKDIETLIPTGYRKDHRQYRKNYSSLPKTRAMGVGRDLFALHKNGDEIPVEIGLNPVKTEEGTMILASVIDISERKIAEQKILDAMKAAEESSKAKEVFLANMSHEIRTPMNAIMGIIQLLEDTPLNIDQLNYLKSLHFAGNQLLRLINDILDLSKIESGKLNIQKSEFDLSKLIGDLVKTMGHQAKLKKLHLKHEVDKSVPNSVIGDQMRLNQILTNLLSNAIKFTEEGYIVLKVSVSKTNKAGNLVTINFVVEDTGIGIALNKQKKIFEAFEQAHSFTTQRLTEGTGLGLSIVKRLTQLHKGQVNLESTPGNGSKFAVEIPYKIPNGVQSDDSTRTDVNFNILVNKKVLLVDDNPLNQMVARKFLENMGIIVNVAGNGSEAIEMIKKVKFDLVLMDIQMPVLDGYETTRSIRTNKKSKSKNIPIIAMTAHVIKGEKEKCLEAGMNDYIPKPLERKSLRDKLTIFFAKNENS